MAFTFVTREAVVSVAHQEKQGSPVIRNDENGGFSATRTLLVDWNDRLEFIRQLRGSTTRNPDVTIRRLPQRFPEDNLAFCLSASAKPFGGMTSAAGVIPVTYEQAEVTALYRIPDGINFPNPGDDPALVLITESLEPSAQFITIPNDGLFWSIGADHPFDSEKVPEEITIGKLHSQLDWVYTIHQQLEVPDNILALIGRVNNADVEAKRLKESPPRISFPRETLLLASLHAERQITTDGPQAWRLTFRFSFNPLETTADKADPKTGWNLFFKRGDLEPQPLLDSGNNQVKPYDQADFTAIVS